MAEKKRGKRRKAPRRVRNERRFPPEQAHTSRMAAGIGLVGSLVLGAGVYGQWIRNEPLEYAQYLVATGAFALGTGLWLGSSGVFPIRVGEAGIAVERGTELDRIAWCDIDKIRIEKDQLMVATKDAMLRIPIGAQPKATAVIVQEAETRLPSVVDISEKDKKVLAPVKDSDGTPVPIEDLQVAGRRCATSDTLISFERDARFCPNCAQVYHRSHVPKKCATCKADLSGRVAAA